MALDFKRGNPDTPVGHAIVYFSDSSDPGKTGATYIMVLPISVDVAKYVPPFLSGHLEGMGSSDVSGFAFPPAPEPVEDAAFIEQIAELRGDDLIFGGSGNLEDTPELMGRVGEMVAEYHSAYQESVSKRQAVPQEPDSAAVSEIDEVMYDLMGEADLLGEMSTLVGRLRYASEGQDKATIDDSVARLLSIGRRLPDNRRVDRIVAAATALDDRSADLIRLYVDRAYALLREDYRRVGTLDGQIADFGEGAPGAGAD
jgi:hypothetical protein